MYLLHVYHLIVEREAGSQAFKLKFKHNNKSKNILHIALGSLSWMIKSLVKHKLIFPAFWGDMPRSSAVRLLSVKFKRNN